MLKRNTFAGAPHITILSLERNRIASIEDGAFELLELKYLFLSNNRIQSLSNNVFRGAPKLFVIALPHNGLKHIGKAFDDCNELTVLRLNYNQIDDIELVAFAKLPRLTDLGIINSGFRWRDEDQWPEKASPLEYLDISQNGLNGSDVLARLRHFPNLEGIYMRDNNLTDLDGFENIGKDFPKLFEIGLSGNKFACAKLPSIVESLQAQNVKLRGNMDWTWTSTEM